MRVIIAGSRHLKPTSDLIGAAVEAFYDKFGVRPTVVLCGCARGADQAGEQWAKENNIPVEHFPAEWDKYGKSAGPIRNGRMAHNAGGLILIWDGKSTGSNDMLRKADQHGLATLQLIREE